MSTSSIVLQKQIGKNFHPKKRITPEQKSKLEATVWEFTMKFSALGKSEGSLQCTNIRCEQHGKNLSRSNCMTCHNSIVKCECVEFVPEIIICNKNPYCNMCKGSKKDHTTSYRQVTESLRGKSSKEWCGKHTLFSTGNLGRLIEEITMYQKTLAQFDGWLWIKKDGEWHVTDKYCWRTPRVFLARKAVDSFIDACRQQIALSENKTTLFHVKRLISRAQFADLSREEILHTLDVIVRTTAAAKPSSEIRTRKPVAERVRHFCTCADCPHKRSSRKKSEEAVEFMFL